MSVPRVSRSAPSTQADWPVGRRRPENAVRMLLSARHVARLNLGLCAADQDQRRAPHPLPGRKHARLRKQTSWGIVVLPAELLVAQGQVVQTGEHRLIVPRRPAVTTAGSLLLNISLLTQYPYVKRSLLMTNLTKNRSTQALPHAGIRVIDYRANVKCRAAGASEFVLGGCLCDLGPNSPAVLALAQKLVESGRRQQGRLGLVF